MWVMVEELATGRDHDTSVLCTEEDDDRHISNQSFCLDDMSRGNGSVEDDDDVGIK